MLDQAVGHTYIFGETLAPSQRMHMVLLGVNDVAKSAKFYEALGWRRSPTSSDGFVKFNMDGYAISLINRTDLANDALEPTASKSGFSGVALIHMARQPEDVPRILAQAEKAGGVVVKPATRTNWGIAGYFKDPDGHLFEVDWEPVWVFDDAHNLVVDKLSGA
ncbi:VOC family protein [Duganella rivi]|nr:VOC family protein [Duganella rivi]